MLPAFIEWNDALSKNAFEVSSEQDMNSLPPV